MNPADTLGGLSLILTFFFCAFYVVTGIEDLILDLVAFEKRLRPERIDRWILTYFDLLPQKRFAILVPAWQEGNIIGSMLKGNLSRLKYKNFVFLVGCYPNDKETIRAVSEVALNDPRVKVVLNSLNGPTSKGQMLNELISFARFNFHELAIDAYLLQDAEDIIDPFSLSLINYKLDTFDFVQIPVFSLEVNQSDCVGGTYVDEFAESHTKDLLVRESLGAAIPSAGVGTAFSAKVVEAFIRKYGWVFYEGSLTEDYEFGIRSHTLGFKSTFAAYSFWDETKKKIHYIATREYFPKKLKRSIRQKTRWTIGISIQGWKHLGWPGGFSNDYFLYRDRRGLFTNILTFMGYLFIPVCGGLFWKGSVNHLSLRILISLTLFLAAYRLMVRAVCVSRIYGTKALWLLPVRWPISVFINSMACFNALVQTLILKIQGKKFHWVKTEHELPKGFGTEVLQPQLALIQERRAS